jgi:hypothetical protein
MDYSSARQDGVWTDDTSPTGRNRTLYLAWAAIAALVLIATAYLVGFMGGHSSVPELAKSNAALQQQVTGLAHRLNAFHVSQTQCSLYGTDETTMRRLMDSGKFAEAASIAELDLENTARPVCTGSGLLGAWYEARMENLYNTAPSVPMGDTSVAQWNGIRREAEKLGVVQTPALATFSAAFRNQSWPLALAAFRLAVSQGLVSPADNDQIGMYYATLRNVGHLLAFHYTGAARARGLAYLATADRISHVAGLERGEAAADLHALVGTHARTSPRVNASDPVLQALEGK